MNQPIGLVAVLGIAATLLSVFGIWFAVARAERRARERLRAQGSIHPAIIRQLVSRGGPNLGVVLEVQLPSGSVGKSYGGLGDRGYDRAWLTDAFATGKPIEILYHPDARTVLIKDPVTGRFN